MKVLALFCTLFLFTALSAGGVRIIAADKEAGAFLRSKLTQILGQKDFSKGSLTLYVGRTAFGKHLDLSKKRLGEYGYRIWSKDGKNVVIAGSSAAGTLFGAGDFLKRFAGWRYFYPGKTGEVLPKLKKLELPGKLDICEVPTILHYNSSGGSRDFVFSRTKGRFIHYATNHAMDKVVPPAKYGKTHPEYYPVRNGKRIDVTKYSRAMGWNPCISNPDMKKLLSLYLRGLKKKHINNMTLSVNDGGGDCQCAKCTALFEKYGNQYAEFYKACSDEIGKKYPGKLGVFIAYGIRSNQAPRNIKLGPNVMAVICGAREGIYDTELEAWKNAGAQHIGIYDYNYTFGQGYMVPRFYPRDLAANWRKAAQYGLKALILEVYTNSAIIDAPRLYVMDELGWNLNVDVEKVLQDYYVTMFGKDAAVEVKRFYDRLEEIFCRKKFPSYYHDRRKAVQFDNYTLEDLAFLRGALDRGLKRTLSPIQHRRLELLRKSFELSALCIEVAVRGREAEKMQGDPEKIAAYVAAGYKALEKLKDFTLSPEDEKEIFIPPRRKRKNANPSQLGAFKEYHIPGLLQPILDHGSLVAFNNISRTLGKEKAAKFFEKYKTLPPARCQLEMPKVKKVNMLPNPGFELKVVSKEKDRKGAVDWEKFPAPFISSWTAVNAVFKHEKKIRHSGEYSGMIGTSEGSSCFVGRAKLILKAGAWYCFRIWVRHDGKVSPASRGSATVRFYHNNRSVGAPVTTARILFTPACHGKWHCYTRYFRAPDIKGGVLSAQWLCGVDSQGDDTPIYFDDLELFRLSK